MAYTITITPYRVAFIDVDTLGWSTFDTLVDFLFLADVVINSFSAYYKEGEVLVTSNKEIILNYMKSWMIIDIFTSLPYALIFSTNYSSLSRLGRLPKIYRLIKIAKLFRVIKFLKNKNKFMECLEFFSKISVGVERLIYFFLVFIGLVHIISCIWFFFSKFSSGNTNWVTKYDIQDDPDSSQYLSSFYWTITTLTTVGYGDIVPSNSIERFFCIFVMLGGVFFYSYTIGTITSVIGQIEKKKSKLRSKILVLQDITAKYSLSKNFYNRLKSDLEYDQRKLSKERNNMIANLPKTLAIRLNYLINQKFIENNSFFIDQPLEFITAVLKFLRPLHLKAKEVVYKQGDYSDEMFFVKSGELTYFDKYKNVDIPFYEISEGEYFGDIELFFSDYRKFSIKALNSCDILTLYRDDLFNHIMQNFENLKIPLILQARSRKEKYEKIRQEAITEYINTKNLINDIVPNFDKTVDQSSEVDTFKRKFNKLKNTLSPATRVLLDPIPSKNLEGIKNGIMRLTERLRKLERYYGKLGNQDSSRESGNSVIIDDGMSVHSIS